MSLLKELVKLNNSNKVNEMDFEFGGKGPQPGPNTTDGPMEPHPDHEYGDYADYEKADPDGAEMDDPLAGEDHLEMEIPFIIKLLEWAHEEAQSDEEIHKVVENLLALDKAPLTMEDFESALEGITQHDEMTSDMSDGMGGAPEHEDGHGDIPAGNGLPLRNADTSQDAPEKIFRMAPQ